MDGISYRIVFDIRWWYWCVGVEGWIEVSVVLGFMLWSSVMYSSFNVRGG